MYMGPIQKKSDMYPYIRILDEPFKTILKDVEHIICRYKASCGKKGHIVNNKTTVLYAFYSLDITSQVIEDQRFNIICEDCLNMCKMYNSWRPIHIMYTILDGKYQNYCDYQIKI